MLSADLYWPQDAAPPPGESALPALSFEGLLLTARRLDAGLPFLPIRQQRPAEQLLRAFADFAAAHPVACEQKAQRAWRARLVHWQEFLGEYRDDPQIHFRRYPYEARQRVMLRLLGEQTRDLPADGEELLAALDAVLRSALQPGAFVWETEVQTGFPVETYWFLYGNLHR